MKLISIKYKPILFAFVSCLLFSLFVACHPLSVQAKTKSTPKQTSLAKLNSIIEENEKEITALIEKQQQLNTDCSNAIKNALEQGLLVNETDLKSLQDLSADLEKKTEKLKAAKVQQEDIQKELDSMTNTKSSKYRKNKCKIITLQNRRFKLISQINKDMKKIIKLCTPEE
jgi:hypothetical protein